jgi:outer membrane immunogenic protein
MRRMVTTALSLLVLHGAAGAADLPPPPRLPPLEAQPVWTGFYAGLNVGGAFGSSRNAFSIAGFGLPSFSTSLAGVVGGAEAGYNWQTGPWVLGLEANFEGSGLSGGRTAPCLPPLCGALTASYAQSLSWFGTLRPRVGYALGNWLLYATGGGALGQVGADATAAVGSFVATDNRSQTRSGWNARRGSRSRTRARLERENRISLYRSGQPHDDVSPEPANLERVALQRPCDHRRHELPLLTQSAPA